MVRKNIRTILGRRDDSEESGGQTPRDFGAADLEDSKPGSCFVPCQVLGFPPFHCRTGSLVQDSTKLNVTIATDVEGWDKSVNEQFLLELAKNPQVIVTGFVPKHTPEQKDHARKLNIELVNAKNVKGFPKVELLNYPPDDLDIDILIIHSYGRDLGRQAQTIKEKKKCLWVNVVHTVSEDLEKFSVKKSTDPAENDEITERDLQISLCMESDLILAIGPIVAEAFRSALRSSGKDKSVIDLTPGIIEEFLHVRQEINGSGEIFRVLLSASSKYFMVKGCDIATKAINLLQDSSYHLIFVRQPKDNEDDLKQDFHDLGINEHQLTIRQSSGREDEWRGLLGEVDLLIKPSRTEGFGVSGLRAISADLPVLVSGKCGLGKVMKSLHSGAQHVIDSEDPQTWADAIKKVRAKAVQKRREDSEELRKYYVQRFNWKKQCDEIVKKMFSMNANKSERQKKEENNKDKKGTARRKRGAKGKERISKKEGKGTKEIGGGTNGKRVRRWPVRWIRLCFKPSESGGQTPQDFEATDLKGKRSITPDGDNKQYPTECFEKCDEKIEEYDQAVEVQQYETVVMVNEERTPENVSHRSHELRLVAEKKINQAEGKVNEEMEDALQRGAQELSKVTRKFESKRMDYKQKVEIVQDRTQEVGHAAAKEINKKRSGFDQVDSEEKTREEKIDSRITHKPERSISPDGENKHQNLPGYEAYLKDLLQASQAGFDSLCLRANQLKREIPPLTLKEKGNFVSDIDEKSQKLIPTGKLNGEYVALRTKGDGNCLYRAASILACGDERKHLEMRVRTVVELACHKSHYLNVPNIQEKICAIEQYIQRKSSREGREKCSGELNKSVLEVEFEEEVRDTCKYSAWASDWHLQVLPTIFRRPVKIVFPEGIRGLDEFFNDIRPRDRCSMLEPLVIMWTSTEPSEEMVLNHFVPLVPLGNVCSLGKGLLVQDPTKLNVTLATDAEGWNLADDMTALECFEKCVEQSEEYAHAIEVQQYETEVMVNEERTPENVSPRSLELRLVAEKKINQAKEKANEEMGDALQRGAQELSNVTRKFESKRMDYKQMVKIVQDRTQEVGHAAAKEINKKRSEFDSEGAALDGANDSESNRDQTGQLVKAQDIPFSVLSKICKELNNKDELSGRDFRLLGKKMGFDKSLTKDLELKVNPTYELLEMWRPNPESTVENLLMILKDDEMGKWDVAAILENWLKKKINN